MSIGMRMCVLYTDTVLSTLVINHIKINEDIRENGIIV